MTVREDILHHVLADIDFVLSAPSLAGATRYHMVDGKTLGIRVFVRDENDIYVEPAKESNVNSRQIMSNDIVTKVMGLLLGPLIEDKVGERFRAMDNHTTASANVASNMMDRLINLEARANVMSVELKQIRDEIKGMLTRSEESGQ